MGLCPAGMSAQNQFSYQTSWIGNDGGTEATHVPHSMDAMFVREDGMVATITGWDEGGTNVGVWKDGALACRPLDSGTGSWGKNSGQAVVIDDRCVYQLMIFNGNSGNDGLNSNGLRQYPPKTAGVEWQVITRYWIASGTAASFKTGYGPNGNMLLVATQEGRYLTGLALADEKLIVAVPGVPELGLADSIKIYDKDNLTASNQPIGGFRIPEGQAGYLAADDRGYVWMLQRDSNRIVCLDLESGAMRSKLTIDLAADVVAKSFTVDKYNDRILVGNQGKDCNVLIYTNIYDKPELTSTFGVTGGIYVESDKPDGSGKYQKGELGHMRFPGPTGAGVDKYGNIYVSCMYPGTATAALYSYKEATQEFNWKLEGLCFTSTADFDLNDKNLFRTPEKLYRVDYSKLGGRLDEAIASTFDPFTFPREMRNFTSPIVCGVFNRKVQGRDYMFVTDMYSNRLASYRYDPDNYGYIAVPCTEICPDSMWVDKNADGQRSADEMRVFDRRIGTFSNYPDRDGNMYKYIVIQDLADPKQGLKISIDANSLYGVMPIGQVISIRCNGLAIGKYADVYQLGCVYYNNDSDTRKQGYEPGRIPYTSFISRCQIVGSPDPAAVVADTLTIEQIKNSGREVHSRLVVIEDAEFTGWGKDPFDPVELDETGHATVEFYTSDAPADYSIMVEGVSQQGKIIDLDTSFPQK